MYNRRQQVSENDTSSYRSTLTHLLQMGESGGEGGYSDGDDDGDDDEDVKVSVCAL